MQNTSQMKVHVELTWKLFHNSHDRKGLGELDATIDSTDCVHLEDVEKANDEYWRSISSETYCVVKDTIREWVREFRKDPKFCYFYNEDLCVEAYIKEK